MRTANTHIRALARALKILIESHEALGAEWVNAMGQEGEYEGGIPLQTAKEALQDATLYLTCNPKAIK